MSKYEDPAVQTISPEVQQFLKASLHADVTMKLLDTTATVTYTQCHQFSVQFLHQGDLRVVAVSLTGSLRILFMADMIEMT